MGNWGKREKLRISNICVNVKYCELAFLRKNEEDEGGGRNLIFFFGKCLQLLDISSVACSHTSKLNSLFSRF